MCELFFSLSGHWLDGLHLTIKIIKFEIIQVQSSPLAMPCYIDCNQPLMDLTNMSIYPYVPIQGSNTTHFLLEISYMYQSKVDIKLIPPKLYLRVNFFYWLGLDPRALTYSFARISHCTFYNKRMEPFRLLVSFMQCPLHQKWIYACNVVENGNMPILI